jgi:deoxyinosine 3'endonuclease (endonuclease V)
MHPAGFGLACHLGVLADIPTVGVGKNVGYFTAVVQFQLTSRSINIQLLRILSPNSISQCSPSFRED